MKKIKSVTVEYEDGKEETWQGRGSASVVNTPFEGGLPLKKIIRYLIVNMVIEDE